MEWRSTSMRTIAWSPALHRRLVILLYPAILLVAARQLRAEIPQDSTWTANADLRSAETRSMPNLGAMQGVTFLDGKVYLYGDVWNADPRVGVIREYTKDYEPTGRVVWLRCDGKPLLRHPTGLTRNPRFGTFLGD